MTSIIVKLCTVIGDQTRLCDSTACVQENITAAADAVDVAVIEFRIQGFINIENQAIH